MLSFARASKAAIFAAPLLILASDALAQQRGLLDDFFGGNQQPPSAARRAPDEADLAVRLERLENHIRQLTGAMEQLQFRNQQLEQQIQRLGGTVPSPNVAATPPMPPRGAPTAAPLSNPPAVIAAEPRRRSDVFDPNENPSAPGAPRPLGSMIATADPNAVPAVGAPGGRVAGAPLDLGTPGGSNLEPLQQDAGVLPPPPPRNPNATGAQTASIAPPAATARDEFDLAYGYVQRKDYALAEDSLRGFLTKYPNDMRVAEAQFWLGESLFQRQRYRDAAESFLTVTTKHERTVKAPDALLRLGQSLAALGEKETACAAWGEISRKYARASEQVKKTVAAEQKRVRC